MTSRLLVVSHPCVIPENQEVYLELSLRGWPLNLVTPARWRHAYREEAFAPTPLRGLEHALRPLPVVMSGHPQRHVYRALASRLVARDRFTVAFVEQEPFALSAFQWGRALARAGIPFGVQMDENLDRTLPALARAARDWVLRHAAFVAARSPGAAALASDWGARGAVAIVPHAVPAWPEPERTPRDDTMTVGFAGRLVKEKGLLDLTAAVSRMQSPVRLLVVGSGPLMEHLMNLESSGLPIEVRRGVPHGEMPSVLAEMDVLVLPSRTTARWAEQFGRILVAALWSGVPVVGSDSGAIPWVIETTGGGRIVPEGAPDAIAAVLDELARDPDERQRLARRGARVAREQFSRAAVADSLEILLRAAEGPR